MKTTAAAVTCLLLTMAAARADSLNCRLVGNYNYSPGFANKVAVVDSVAYVAWADGGMRVISIADPTIHTNSELSRRQQLPSASRFRTASRTSPTTAMASMW
jgi:hypothetical protein